MNFEVTKARWPAIPLVCSRFVAKRAAANAEVYKNIMFENCMRTRMSSKMANIHYDHGNNMINELIQKVTITRLE